MSAATGRDLLAALVHAPAGWCDPRGLGGDEAAWDALVASGDVQRGVDPLTGTPVVALTPLGASRLHVHLEETVWLEVFWSPDGEGASARPGLPPTRAALAAAEAHSAALDRHADPRPDPAALVEAADELRLAWEEVRKRRPRDVEDLPWPSVVVGLGAPFYMPEDDFHRHNRAAHASGNDYPENLQRGRVCKYCFPHMPPGYVCPRCSNWGLDGVFARLLAAAVRARRARAAGANM